MPTSLLDREDVTEKLLRNFPIYAEECLQIVPKKGKRIRFRLKTAQLVLERKLEEQRVQGNPQRAVILKARQIGFSSFCQGKLLQRSTLMENHNALVVAHDRETGGSLYLMAERMYSNLPDDPDFLKPDIRSHGRARFMHFGDKGSDAWQAGAIYPDSTYSVGTAGEFEAGRGATFHSLHLSEVAFWPQIEQKLTALLQAVPDDPDSLVIVESTANGHNEMKDLWDRAVEGRNEFAPVFWPWWKEPEYSRSFANDAERDEFEPGSGPWGEDEPTLLEGVPDFDTGEIVKLTLEQLNWRRWAIENKLNGKLDKFKQEYPSYPEEAFLATGNRVFDGNLVRGVLKEVEQTDPRLPEPDRGPEAGAIRETKFRTQAGRSGPVSVPIEPKWLERSELSLYEEPLWRVWKKPEEDRGYVVGADVSGGVSESDDETAEPAYHALQVIDHLTKEQVCEYRSRVDPDLFAAHAYLTALHYNQAWLAIEVTGGYGIAPARKVAHDFRYNRTFRRQTVDRSADHQQDRIGWDTNRATKPILLAGGQELLREGSHGIRSRRLALEMLTYVRSPTGKTAPEPGKFADLLMAWLIAQQVALQLPPVPPKKKGSSRSGKGYRPRDRVSGY